MITRALVVWLGLVALAVANGWFRQGVLLPRLGERVAHVLSTLLLAALILIVACSAIEWMDPSSARDALAVGILWTVLTIAFEFGAGHFAFGEAWSELFADYNVLRGRVWPLVLLVTALAPLAAAHIRRLPAITR